MKSIADHASKLPFVTSSNTLPYQGSREHRDTLNRFRGLLATMPEQDRLAAWDTYTTLHFPSSYMYAVSMLEVNALHASKREPVVPAKPVTQYDYSKTVYKSQAERRTLHTDYVKAVINELPTDAIEYVSHTIDMLLLMPTISKPEYMAHEVTL